jgi:hypothetical protein
MTRAFGTEIKWENIPLLLKICWRSGVGFRMFLLGGILHPFDMKLLLKILKTNFDSSRLGASTESIFYILRISSKYQLGSFVYLLVKAGTLL